MAADEIATKGTVVAVPFDLSTDEEIAHLVAAANERWDGLDILVKNAAPRGGESIDHFSPQGWDKMMNVNTGSFNGLTPPERDTFSYSFSLLAVEVACLSTVEK